MKHFHAVFSVFFILFASANLFAQHSLQLDNGLGAYSIITGSTSGGTYTLPNGGGAILTNGGGGPALVWLTAGNILSGGSASTPNEFLGSNNIYDIVMKSSGAERMRISSTGNITIGAINSIYGSKVFATRTSNATGGAAAITTESQVAANPSIAGSNQFIGTYSYADGNNTASISSPGGLFGLWGAANINPAASATISAARGLEAEIYHNGPVTVTDAACLNTLFQQVSTGGITSGSCLRAVINKFGGNMTDLKILNVADAFTNSGGTITNTYGIYIGSLTNGTQTNQPYAVYSSDANARTYLAGNVGVATSTPNSTMDVSGSVGAAIRLAVPGDFIGPNDYTIINKVVGNAYFNPFAAPSNARRIYVFVNEDANPIFLLGSTYIDFTGANIAVVPANSSITIQSDGTNWYRIH